MRRWIKLALGTACAVALGGYVLMQGDFGQYLRNQTFADRMAECIPFEQRYRLAGSPVSRTVIGEADGVCHIRFESSDGALACKFPLQVRKRAAGTLRNSLKMERTYKYMSPRIDRGYQREWDLLTGEFCTPGE